MVPTNQSGHSIWHLVTSLGAVGIVAIVVVVVIVLLALLFRLRDGPRRSRMGR